jgi:plastocyanin
MKTKWAQAFGAATLALVLWTLAGTASAAEQKDTAALCAEAAARYQDMTGRAPGDEDVTIVLADKYVFCPQKLAVPAGTTVRWVNVEKRSNHSVWFKQAGRDETDRFFPEESVEQTLDLPPGDHPYLCGPHWEDHGMVGMVTVTE